MSRMNFKSKMLVFSIIGSAVLAGCSDDNKVEELPLPPVVITPPPVVITPPPVVMQNYEVIVTNLTPNQPLSPVTLIAHSDSNPLFTAGTEASEALENLAESGNNEGFASEPEVSQVVGSEASLAPGAKETLTISFEQNTVQNLSVLTMLVNTNDAFTGISNFELASLDVGEEKIFRTNVYDSGTEDNSEAKGTIPGPIDSGEGFNAERNDVNKIHIHPGVITMHNGLSDSILSASHRFDNPAMIIVIRRTN